MDIFKNIADSKAFQNMPKGAQVLYFHLAACADEQGKVSQKDLDKVPLILLICSAAVVISNLIKLRPLPVLIGVIGIALAIMNLRSAIKNHKAGKGSDNTSGSLPSENSEW